MKIMNAVTLVERIFLNLLTDSGYPGIKFDKKIDFTELYKQKSN